MRIGRWVPYHIAAVVTDESTYVRGTTHGPLLTGRVGKQVPRFNNDVLNPLTNSVVLEPIQSSLSHSQKICLNHRPIGFSHHTEQFNRLFCRLHSLT